MTMTMDYPQLSFPVWLNPTVKVNLSGYLVGELAVTYSDTRYKSISVINCYGFEVVKVRFKTFEDGIQFAHFLEDHYKEYFILYSEDQRADVPGLTRYTIPDGEALYDIFTKFHNQIVTFQEIKNELYK